MKTTIDQIAAGQFEEETIALANECFARFEKINRRPLRYLTARADKEAMNLIRTGFPAAIAAAETNHNIPFARHIRALLGHVPRAGTFMWLSELATDGKAP
jgi:hypothetical protein